jgi:hypothetical protein
MKNIHVLPTDKTSRLVLDVNNNLALAFNKSIEENALYKRTIYITSDEEIKVSDYVYDSDINIVLQINNSEALKRYVENGRVFWYKIILTTDQDLIKDGVQAIPDEFLEWFCKNNSCERVDISTYHIKGDISGRLYYKIIIPQEEPKQDIVLGQSNSVQAATRADFERDIKSETLEEHYLSIPKPLVDVSRMKIDNHPDINKQETLEEAAERFRSNNPGTMQGGNNTKILNAFIAGAKWQAERSCSEEEVQKLIKIIEWYDEESDVRPDYFKEEDGLTLFEWFEQFKKK